MYSPTVTWIKYDIENGEPLPFDPDPSKVITSASKYALVRNEETLLGILNFKDHFEIDPFITNTYPANNPTIVVLMQGVTL